MHCDQGGIVTQSIIEGLVEDFRRRRDDYIEIVILLIVEAFSKVGWFLDDLSNRLKGRYDYAEDQRPVVPHSLRELHLWRAARRARYED
jgi:hypothetical protein